MIGSLCKRIRPAPYLPRLHTALPRGLATRAPQSAYAEKYQAQLERKAQQMGMTVEQMKEKMKSEIEERKKAMNAADPLAELEEHQRKQAAQAGEVRSGFDPKLKASPYKTLSLFVDTAKLQELPPKELLMIWRARFQSMDRAMAAVVQAEQFGELYANAFRYPSFVLPLPRGDGYEMHFVQWSFVGPQTTHCMLTSLAEYKLHKEYAKPHTTLMFHQELVEPCGVVLMNGQLEADTLSMDEAQLLVLNVQRFYGVGLAAPERKLALLKAFATGDKEFSTEKLIEESSLME